MDSTGMMAGGLIGFVIGIVIVVSVFALLVMAASKIVMGKAVGFGNAAIAVIVAGIANAAVNWGLSFLPGAVPSIAVYAIYIQFAANVLVTIAVYMRLLDSDGRKPNFLQAFLIFLLEIVIAVVLIFACYFLAANVFHIAMPDLSQYEQMP